MAFESSWINLFFFLLFFASAFCQAFAIRIAPPAVRSCYIAVCWEARTRTESRIGKGIGTNLSSIGKNRANPRATGRWTTWKHVALEIVAPKSGREEKRRDELNALEEIERSRFLGTRRTNTDPTKRFRSFDIPKPPRSYSFCRPSASAPSTALKRCVFAHRDQI